MSRSLARTCRNLLTAVLLAAGVWCCPEASRTPSRSWSSSTASRSPHSISSSAASSTAAVDAQGACPPGSPRRADQREAQGEGGQEIGVGNHQLRGRHRLWHDGRPDALDGRSIDRVLAKSGINPQPSRPVSRRISLGRNSCAGDIQSSLQIGEKDILTAMDLKTTDSRRLDYTLRPILFLVPPGRRRRSLRDASAKRKPCAAGFRTASRVLLYARPQGCGGARSGHSQLGRPPAGAAQSARRRRGRPIDGARSHQVGIEMFAMCAEEGIRGRQFAGSAPGARAIMAQRYEQRSKQYLAGTTSGRDARIQIGRAA